MPPMIINIFSTLSTVLFIRDDLYLDPGSGSFLIQLIIASLLGAAFVLRTSWSKIKSFFSRNPDGVEDEADVRDEDEG